MTATWRKSLEFPMRSHQAHILKHFTCFLTTLFALAIAPTFLIAQTPATAPTAPQPLAIPATIEAYWSVDLCARTSGYVTQVKADLGDHVTHGDLMAVLAVPEIEKNLLQTKALVAAKTQMARAADSTVAQAKQAIAVAQKQLERDKVELEYQQVTLKRQQELSAGNAITPQQLDEARTKADAARAGAGISEAKLGAAQADLQAAEANRLVAAAQVDVAKAAVEEVETLLAYARITAPFDGVITRRMVNIGDLVQGGATKTAMPLFTLQQIDTVRVFCDVPELKTSGIRVGDAAQIKIYSLDNQSLSATVTRLANSLNPATRTMRVEIDLKNPGETLRPGMYAQVTLNIRPAAPTADATPKQ
jgi:multidrug resistance efflux pump